MKKDLGELPASRKEYLEHCEESSNVPSEIFILRFGCLIPQEHRERIKTKYEKWYSIAYKNSPRDSQNP